MSDEVLKPCPICSKKVYIGLYGDGRDYWWMVHGGMHYDECKCRLFMESCKFELEDEAKVDCDEYATGIRDGLVRRWSTRAELVSGTCEPNWVLQGKTQTQEFWRCECGNCGHEFGVETRESFPLKMTIGKVDVPNYCPNCGKSVKR